MAEEKSTDISKCTIKKKNSKIRVVIKVENREYCMSSFLTFRYIEDENIKFRDDLDHKNFRGVSEKERIYCATWQDIDEAVRMQVNSRPSVKRGILLSGGMDSAILASYLPAGSIAYTFRSLAEGSIDETAKAKMYADKYHLQHKIVDLTWDDLNSSLPQLMKAKGAPVHSIEPQIYKAAIQAKADGVEELLVGESADLIFGGMDKLLAKDWTYDEWVARYTFVNPAIALKSPVSMEDIYKRYKIKQNEIDFENFMNDIYKIESSSSYMNAFAVSGMNYFDPYACLCMSEKLDLYKVRNGKSKYLIRELFAVKYSDIQVPEKIPMPRAVNQWLKDYKGSNRPEFTPHCADSFTGDQKWLVYCLSEFLNMLDKGVI